MSEIKAISNFSKFRPIQKGDKKTIRAWVMYDWANSVYQLTILSVIFPIYYNSVTSSPNGNVISIFGFDVINSAAYSWSISIAYLLVAMFSPLFSAFADYTGRRKTFMKVFTILGALSVAMLFFFDKQHIQTGVIFFTLATLGYGGSLVFYNSFLPIIAKPEDQDMISARGYSMGYLGAVILLLFNLVFVLKPELFGITDKTFPAKLAFVTVGIWWIGFSSWTFLYLPKYTFGHRKKGVNMFFEGYKELQVVSKQVFASKKMTLYLIGFFFVISGILTVMFMAALFGAKELGLSDSVLIPVILLIQLVAMLGAFLSAKLSARFGNIHTLSGLTIAWILIVIGAYFINGALGFVIIAFFVGLIMGGSQALTRSTFSKMIPADTKNHTSFFSFYDVMEKLATVVGTFSFGLIETLTGSMRTSIVSIISFFLVGLMFFIWLIRTTNKPQLIENKE
ncbi:MAG: major facilitator superfamily permease [Bacteroidetes bacterium]|nr:MAG: major facilitator superfamily permease [Bacteroidota bacterium]